MRTIGMVGLMLLVSGALAASVAATTGAASKKVVGTARGDVLKGTAQSDTILGLAGNDVEYGYAGNDILNGGSGNDRLIGGAGSDTYRCGAGNDTVIGAGLDRRPPSDCEVVKGFPPAQPRSGHYAGTTSQQKSIEFDVVDGAAVANVSALVDQQCQEMALLIRDVPIEIAGPIALDTTRTFTTRLSYGAGSGLQTVSISGTIDEASDATGTLDAEWVFYPGGRETHCTTAALTWSAQ